MRAAGCCAPCCCRSDVRRKFLSGVRLLDAVALSGVLSVWCMGACVSEGLLTEVMGRWVGCSVTHLVYPLGCCKLTGFDVRFGRWLTAPPPNHCQLYLVLTIFHELHPPPQPSHLPPPPLLCFTEEYLSECFWQVIHIAPISCDLQSYFIFFRRAQEKKVGKPLKSEIMNWEVCTSQCFSGRRVHKQKTGQGRLTQPETCAPPSAGVEWHRAKWAWPLRRGNSITVCQSLGRAGDRLL